MNKHARRSQIHRYITADYYFFQDINSPEDKFVFSFNYTTFSPQKSRFLKEYIKYVFVGMCRTTKKEVTYVTSYIYPFAKTARGWDV